TDRCNARAEIVPAEATIHVRRDTPPLYGLGLVERIPDDKILKFVDPLDQNHDGISGRANFVNGRVGRFGWKAQVVSLRDFAGADALDQLGLTSPAFPAESKPQGGQVTCDLVGDPEDKGTSVQGMADFVTFLAPLPAALPPHEVQRLPRRQAEDRGRQRARAQPEEDEGALLRPPPARHGRPAG